MPRYFLKFARPIFSPPPANFVIVGVSSGSDAMAEIRLNVPESFAREVNASLRAIALREGREPRELTLFELAREAMAVYKWVVSQAAAGRSVLSTDEALASFTLVSTPSLPAVPLDL
jgi:hypothetical protein